MKRLQRVLKRRRSKKGYQQRPFSFYHSVSLSRLREGLLWAKANNRGNTAITIPRTFSIISSPERALDVIGQVVNTAGDGTVESLYFDHSHLVVYDLAAEAMLDFAVEEIRRQCGWRGQKLDLRGRYPSDQKALRFIAGKGLPWRLKVATSSSVAHEFQKLQILEKRTKTEHAQERRLGSMTPKERDVHDFMLFIDSCLQEDGRELTENGRQELGTYLSEILDNVVEHSGSLEWIVEGYLDSSDASLTCEIVIANIGTTIAESLMGLPSGHFTRIQIDPFVAAHSKRRLFDSDWRKEDLFTLAALQGGVSAQNTSADSLRGNGTVEFIQFFQDVYEECISTSSVCSAEMIVLSGSTFIHFDGSHRMQYDNGRYTIAFNKNNDLRDRPQKSSVRNLGPRQFPGTVISIRFPLRDTNLETQA